MTSRDHGDINHAIESPTDICQCGHMRRGHHRLCNGKTGGGTGRVQWCTCKLFRPKDAQ